MSSFLRTMSQLSLLLLLSVVMLTALALPHENKNGEFESLLSKLDKKVKNASASEKEMIQMGRQLLGQKRYREAIDLLTQVSKIYPKSDSVYFYIGLAYQYQSVYRQAKINYLKAKELNPDHVDTLVNLGTLYATNSIFDQALIYYCLALEKKPKYDFAYKVMMATWRQVTDKENPLLNQHMGLVHLLRKDYPLAEKYYLSALEADKNNEKTLANLGTICGRLGRNEEALSYFKKALAINPAYASVIVNFILTQIRLGKKDLARENYDLFKKAYPQKARALQTHFE